MQSYKDQPPTLTTHSVRVSMDKNDENAEIHDARKDENSPMRPHDNKIVENCVE